MLQDAAWPWWYPWSLGQPCAENFAGPRQSIPPRSVSQSRAHLPYRALDRVKRAFAERRNNRRFPSLPFPGPLCRGARSAKSVICASSLQWRRGLMAQKLVIGPCRSFPCPPWRQHTTGRSPRRRSASRGRLTLRARCGSMSGRHSGDRYRCRIRLTADGCRLLTARSPDRVAWRARPALRGSLSARFRPPVYGLPRARKPERYEDRNRRWREWRR